MSDELTYQVNVLRTAVQAAIESLEANAPDQALAHLRGVLEHLAAQRQVDDNAG